MADSGPGEKHADGGDRTGHDVDEPGAGSDGRPDSPEDDRGSESEPEAEESDPVWRFSLEDVNEDGIVQTTVEAGDPDPEHVLFVVLGVLAMLLVFVRLWLLV